MLASEYREIIRTITKNILNKRFPGLNKTALKEASDLIAKNVHSRFYGCNVDGVPSPLWRREDDIEPTIEAVELLK